MAYIYKITNNVNGKIYIGKTEFSIENRFKEHCKCINRDDCKDRPIYRAMRKYGIQNFSIEQVEETDNPCEREQYWIEYYGSFKNGYNATLGGDGKKYIDYDLVVEIYKQLKCMSDVAKYLNISTDSVSNILNIKKIKKESSTDIQREKCGKIVNMYDLDHRFLRSFLSLHQAADYMVENKLTKCKHSTIRTHISEVCKGKRKTAAKFIWEFQKD